MCEDQKINTTLTLNIQNSAYTFVPSRATYGGELRLGYQARVRLHPKGVPVYTCIHAVLGVACIHAVYTHLKYMECQHGQVTSNLLLQYTNDTIALRCCHDHVGSSVASTCATNTWPAPPLAVALVVDTRSAMGIVYGSESFTSCTLSRSD